MYQKVIDNYAVNSIKEAAGWGYITGDQESDFLKDPNTWDDYVFKAYRQWKICLI